MTGSRQFAAVFAFVLLLPFAVFARGGKTDDPGEFLRALEEKFATITTVETSFVQEKKMAIFRRKITLSGRIYMENGGRLAWHVEKPVRYSLLIADKHVFQWDEDSDRVQRISLSSSPIFKVVADQLKSWFSGKYSSLAADYEVEVVGRRPVKLLFRPKEDSLAHKAVKQVTVTLRKDERYVERIRIEDTSGDRTTIVFSDTVLNGAINDDVWEVKPSGK